MWLTFAYLTLTADVKGSITKRINYRNQTTKLTCIPLKSFTIVRKRGMTPWQKSKIINTGNLPKSLRYMNQNS